MSATPASSSSATPASSKLKPPSSVRTAAFARATDSSSIQMPPSTLQSPLIAAKDATMLSALENMKGELDAAKEYIRYLEEQLREQSPAPAFSAMDDPLNDTTSAHAINTETPVPSTGVHPKESLQTDGCQLQRLQQELADAQLQVVEVRAQRDEAITALEAARLKLSESEVLLPDSPMAKRHVQIDGSKPAARQEQLSLELQAVMMAAEAEQVSSVENRNSQIRQLQDLLSQAQEQLRQQHLQHEHQRALLQRSCQELQSEASLASSNLVACKREVDLLKLRLEEVEAACDDLRLDKELREAEAEESAAMIANGLDHSANNMMLQQIQVFVTENKNLRQQLSDAHESAAAAAADHRNHAATLRDEISGLRALCSAAETTEGIVASLTDQNTVLVDAVRALKGRITELEELAEMSRMLEDALQEREGDLRRDITTLQDEVIALRWKLHQAETEAASLKDRLSGSLAHATASSCASESSSTDALKLVIDVQHREIETLRNRVASADRSVAFANMECIIHVARARSAIAVAAVVPLSQQRLLQACATLQYEVDVQLLILDWMFCIVCNRMRESRTPEDTDLANVIVVCFQAVYDIQASIRCCSINNTQQVDDSFFAFVHSIAQVTETLQMSCLGMCDGTADTHMVTKDIGQCCAAFKSVMSNMESCFVMPQYRNSIDGINAVHLSVTLRKCILLVLSIYSNIGGLSRVLHQAQAVQLSLLLQTISSTANPDNLAPFVSVLNGAHRLLESASVCDTDSPEIPSDLDSPFQQLRDTISALNHVCRGVPLPVGQFDVDYEKRVLHHTIGVYASALSGILIKDTACSFTKGSGLLGHVISGVREELAHSLDAFSAATAAAARASASVATLTSSLEREQSLRAAADIKTALLHRECLQLRDELARSLDTTAAISSSSEAQAQLMSSQMELLQSANDALIDDVKEKVGDINRLQLHLQQLEQRHVRQHDQASPDRQCHSSARKDVAAESVHTLYNGSLSGMRSLLQSGDHMLHARTAYTTGISLASMHYPRLSLQAVAAAANLAHELTTVRKSRINALGVVDLCSTGACKDYNVDCEGSAVARHGRCLQATLSARILVRKLE